MGRPREERVLHGHRLVGPPDREAARLVLEILLGDLERVRGDALDLATIFSGRMPECDAADGKAPAPVGIKPELRDGGVAVEELDLVDRDAQPIGRDLREGRRGPGREARCRRRPARCRSGGSAPSSPPSRRLRT